MHLVGEESTDMVKRLDKTEIPRLTMVLFFFMGGMLFFIYLASYLAADKNILQNCLFLFFFIFSIYSFFLSDNKLRSVNPVQFWIRKAFKFRVLLFCCCITIYLFERGAYCLYLTFSIIVTILSIICYAIGIILYDNRLMDKNIKDNIKFIGDDLDPEQAPPANVLLYSFRSSKNRLIRVVSGNVFKFVFLFMILPLSLLGGGAGYFILGILRLYLGDSDISAHAIGYFMVLLPTSMYFAFQLPALINFNRKWKTIYPMK